MANADLSKLPRSRQEAREQGAKFYFTGKPCKKGHLDKRTSSEGKCLLCGRERVRLYSAKWRAANREKARKRIRDHYHKHKNDRKDWYITGEICKNGHSSPRNKYGQCIECGRERFKRWKAVNGQRAKDIQTKYLTDHLNVRIAYKLRSRLYSALRGKSKCGSAVRDLGCTINFLRGYLEARFQDGMCWANYGKVWHIDHIRPLISFDLTDRGEFLKACHYTNLQPLFAKDNFRKGKLSQEEWSKRLQGVENAISAAFS